MHLAFGARAIYVYIIYIYICIQYVFMHNVQGVVQRRAQQKYSE